MKLTHDSKEKEFDTVDALLEYIHENLVENKSKTGSIVHGEFWIEDEDITVHKAEIKGLTSNGYVAYTVSDDDAKNDWEIFLNHEFKQID